MRMVQEAPEETERRRHPRYDLMAQVRVKQAQIDYVMDLSNISLTGALMHMGKLQRPGWIAVGRTLEIGIIHPIDYQVLVVTGAVVRVLEDEEGISLAVDFSAPDAQASQTIAQLVKLAITGGESPPGAAKPQPPPLPKP
jgi:hypothetical protein